MHGGGRTAAVLEVDRLLPRKVPRGERDVAHCRDERECGGSVGEEEPCRLPVCDGIVGQPPWDLAGVEAVDDGLAVARGVHAGDRHLHGWCGLIGGVGGAGERHLGPVAGLQMQFGSSGVGDRDAQCATTAGAERLGDVADRVDDGGEVTAPGCPDHRDRAVDVGVRAERRDRHDRAAVHGKLIEVVAHRGERRRIA